MYLAQICLLRHIQRSIVKREVFVSALDDVEFQPGGKLAKLPGFGYCLFKGSAGPRSISENGIHRELRKSNVPRVD